MSNTGFRADWTQRQGAGLQAHLSSSARAGVLALVVGLLALPAESQEGGGGQENDGRPQTELQNEAEAAVRAVCSGLAVLNDQDSLVGLEVELFRRCNEMIETANELDGVTDPERIDASLGLGASELAGAWQQLAGEEAATQGTLGTEVSDAQLDNLGARIAAIRRGMSGMTVVDIGLYTGSGTMRLGDLDLPLFSQLSGDGGDTTTTGSPDGSSRRWGAFLNGTFGFGEKDGTGREDGFDVDSSGVTLGWDYRFSNHFVGGVAVGTATVDADLLAVSSGTVSGGGVEADGTSLSLYFTSFGEKFYLDGSLVLGDDEFTMERRVVYGSRTDRDAQDRVARSTTDGSRTTASLGAGYSGQAGAVSYGPYARLSSLQIDIDGYTEATPGAAELALVIGDQEIDSLVSVLGFDLSRAFSGNSGVLIWQGSAEWNHEFDDDPRTIAAHYAFDPNQLPFNISTDEPDRDYYLASVGLVGVFPKGWQAFLNVDSIFGRENIDFTQVTIGVRLGS